MSEQDPIQGGYGPRVNAELILYRLDQAERQIAAMKAENSEAHTSLGEKIDNLALALREQQVKVGIGAFLVSAAAGAMAGIGVKKLFGG